MWDQSALRHVRLLLLLCICVAVPHVGSVFTVHVRLLLLLCICVAVPLVGSPVFTVHVRLLLLLLLLQHVVPGSLTRDCTQAPCNGSVES